MNTTRAFHPGVLVVTWEALGILLLHVNDTPRGWELGSFGGDDAEH